MISSILLAAGKSSRMGSLKQLLDWGGEPLIRYQVHQLREAGVDEIIVVLGYHSDEIRREMRGLDVRTMLNPRYQFGRAGSLRVGAKAVAREADAVVIMNVDQPRDAAALRTLIEAHAANGNTVTRPAHEGKHGHPIVVSGALVPELLTADDATGGLHGVLDAHAAEIVDVESGAGCLLDLNTPGEYESARPPAPAGA